MRPRATVARLALASALCAACGGGSAAIDASVDAPASDDAVDAVVAVDTSAPDVAPSDDVLLDDVPATDDVSVDDAPAADDAPAPRDAAPADAGPVRCTGATPTTIGGDVFGYPDNNSIDVSIGVELLAAGDVPVDAQGRPCSGTTDTCIGSSNYAFLVNLNPTLAATGAPASTPGLERSWTRCVSSAVLAAYYEGYPRGPGGHTDTSRYGETMSNRMAITPGGTVLYGMRFPLRFEADATNGNTGNVNGYAFCHGAPTPVTRINAWSTTPNAGCGVHAYASGGTIGAASGYWWIGPLAAGQCGAASQTVGVVLHVDCDGHDASQTHDVDDVRGRTVGAVNAYFP